MNKLNEVAGGFLDYFANQIARTIANQSLFCLPIISRNLSVYNIVQWLRAVQILVSGYLDSNFSLSLSILRFW